MQDVTVPSQTQDPLDDVPLKELLLARNESGGSFKRVSIPPDPNHEPSLKRAKSGKAEGAGDDEEEISDSSSSSKKSRSRRKKKSAREIDQRGGMDPPEL